MEPTTKQESFSNRLEEGVKIKLKIAMSNPILESRFMQLTKELDKADSLITDEQIEKELLASCVLANDLTEFRELLKQLAFGYGQSDEWVKDILAHENAHANVALENGYEFTGYAMLFKKNDMGRIVGVQPMIIKRAPKSWSKMEILKKDLLVLNAPEVYGGMLSNFDKDDIGNRNFV